MVVVGELWAVVERNLAAVRERGWRESNSFRGRSRRRSLQHLQSPHRQTIPEEKLALRRALMAAYPKRRAAAIAEELTRQELEQDAGNEQDEGEEADASFTDTSALAAQKKEAKAGGARKRGPA